MIDSRIQVAEERKKYLERRIKEIKETDGYMFDSELLNELNSIEDELEYINDILPDFVDYVKETTKGTI